MRKSATDRQTPQNETEARRPEPRQKPPKTYVVNTDGSILPEEFAGEKDRAASDTPSDLKRPRHYRNVLLSLIGLLVIVLLLMAVFGA